jgi:hypothetical protein
MAEQKGSDAVATAKNSKHSLYLLWSSIDCLWLLYNHARR